MDHRKLASAALAPCALLLAFLGGSDKSLAQPAPPTPTSPAVASEYDLKLAHIYKTAKFIAWPDEINGGAKPFVIGVIEPDPFHGGLQKLAKRRLKDRQIQVVIFKTENDYQPCHVLFIPAEANPETVSGVLKRTANQPVLIWRDDVESLQLAGASCAFVRDGDKVIIEADPAELKRRKLAADGQLMSLNMVRPVKPRK